ncbi:M23 family metallopeptidase [Paragemmobacter ruber]|uniref:Peptidoglycan DD-metalloendopeptidase family protein n=1 Tax=Paragemmobacter ruber TaxID=1985673 RepID=A0ABW9Y2N8_9RHOB|nr:M23 family metallopeptidase [Rhodobacter ruber]NBE06765.1 peptidoglycan DD-metalloendopeptidase family protein [Rhodobacter ruber]
MIRTTAALTLALALPAGAFDFAQPIACTLGRDCHIQNHFDRDPGPGAADVACGHLTYDGHDGTDFALPDLAAMQAGVAVLAAAPGTVRGVRNGMPDIRVTDPAAPPLEGRDCGNGVAIDHGDGWETQYCHLRQGSLTVAPGDRVAAGQQIGLVGLSGNTEFPHVHLAIRKDGVALDPFAPDPASACGAAPQDTLWADPIAYDPFGFTGAGFATDIPLFDAIKAGLPSPATLPADAPALVIWAAYFGPRTGDQLTLAITGPGGEVIRETLTIDRTQAQAFRAIGKRQPPGGWPAGRYDGAVTMTRDGQLLGEQSLSVTIP